jgi:hypothetical protein
VGVAYVLFRQHMAQFLFYCYRHNLSCAAHFSSKIISTIPPQLAQQTSRSAYCVRQLLERGRSGAKHYGLFPEPLADIMARFDVRLLSDLTMLLLVQGMPQPT